MMDPLLRGAIAAVLAVAAVAVAAKAHGRQVRLRREAEGVLAVDFRGPNPPVVEGIWRRDRAGFWSVFVVVGVALAGLGAVGVLRPEPAFAFWMVAAGATFVAAFLVMAAWWAWDLRRAHGKARLGWPWMLGAVALLAAAVTLLWA